MNSKHKIHSKTSKGIGRFAHILRACKMSQYNVRNYKFGRHNRRWVFRRHNTQHKPSLTKIPYCCLETKDKKNRKTKNSSSCQQNQMLCALSFYQDTGNNHLSMDSGYNIHSCINLSYYQGLTKSIQVLIC